LARLIPWELKDLLEGDVPMFIARPNSRDLWNSRGERIPEFFEQTAIEEMRQGLRRLGEEDLERQIWFIRAAIGSSGERVARVSTPASCNHPTPGMRSAWRAPLEIRCAEKLWNMIRTRVGSVSRQLDLARTHGLFKPVGSVFVRRHFGMFFFSRISGDAHRGPLLFQDRAKNRSTWSEGNWNAAERLERQYPGPGRVLGVGRTYVHAGTPGRAMEGHPAD